MTSPAPQPAAEQERAAKPPRRRSRRRWILGVSIALLAILLLIALVIQIVLLTDMPKSIVVGQVERGFGLRMGVNSLTTGWLGHTSMKDVQLALPLSDQSFVSVPELKVDHTNLLGLILGWPMQIKAVEMNGAVVYVRQDADGRWDLQSVAELIARAGGKKTGQESAQTSTPGLPRIHVQNLAIVIVDNKNRQARIEPINIKGDPDSAVSWRYDVEIPSQQPNVPAHLSLLGRVAPGGTWSHELSKVWVNDIAPWVRPWQPSFNQQVSFDGKWTGELTQTGLRGFMQVADARVGIYHAHGAMNVSRNGSVTAISPDNLLLQVIDPTKPAPATPVSLTVPGGTIDYDGKIARATQVQLSLLGGPATFNGWFSPGINQGALEAYWQNLVVPAAGIQQSGKLNLTYTHPLAADFRVAVIVSSSGTLQKSPFEAVFKADATGQSFADIDWQVSTPQLAWYRPQQIILNGLNASGVYKQDAQHKTVRLDKVSLPADNRLAGSGSYDVNTKQGQLHLEGQDWPVHLIEGTHLAFGLDASAKGVASTLDPKKSVLYVDVSQFFLRSGDAQLSFKGGYDGREPKPVRADVMFTNQPGSAAQVGEPALVHGYVLAAANLTGTLDPRAIGIAGSLEGRGAEILGHALGNVQTKINGTIDPDKITVRADGIPLLDGIWNLGATYTRDRDGEWVNSTEVDLSVEHLSLPRVSTFLNAPLVNGSFDGHWYAYFPGFKPDPARLRVTGSGNIRNLAASYLMADNVTFTTSLQDGVFKIDPVRVSRGGYGRIDAHADVALSDWRQFHAGATFTAFPIEIPSAALGLQLWGGTDRFDLSLPDPKAKDPAAQKMRINTDINLRTVIAINQQPEGEVRLRTEMQGRSIRLRQLNGDLLGGTVSGAGATNIDRLDQSRLDMQWNKLQADPIVRLYPQLKGFGGTFSGSVGLLPAPGARALAPLTVDLYLQSTAAHWKTVKIGDAQIHGFIGSHRVIAASDEPSVLHVGGGEIDFWFSSSGHVDTVPTPAGKEIPVGITLSNQLNLTLRQLEIDQFVQAFDPGHAPGLGRLGGSLFLLSAPKTKSLAQVANDAAAAQPPPPTLSPTQPSPTATITTAPLTTAPATDQADHASTTLAQLPSTRSTTVTAATQTAQQQQQTELLRTLLRSTTLDGTIAITKSDLGNFGPISFLYNAMHIGGNVRSPTGHGNVSLHMEEGNLHISNLYYFNRGVEVRGVATASEMWNLPDNPFEGSFAGSARPLKNIKLPLFAEADAILSALQGSLTSVGTKGTVRDPMKNGIQQLGLTQLGGELRGILLGEVGASSQ